MIQTGRYSPPGCRRAVLRDLRAGRASRKAALIYLAGPRRHKAEATVASAAATEHTPPSEDGRGCGWAVTGSGVVRLEWRAEGTGEESYHVFVHLVDGEGRLVRQADGVPGGWRRLTTGWVAGEYVPDEHRLGVEGLPAGEYSFVVGLYEPGGMRLRASDGRDAIVLTTLNLHQVDSHLKVTVNWTVNLMGGRDAYSDYRGAGFIGSQRH